MVKYTKTIRGQFPDELLECVSLFCEVGASRFKMYTEPSILINRLGLGFE